MSEEEKYRDPEADTRRRRILGSIPAKTPEDMLRREMECLAEKIKADRPKQSA